MAKLRINGDSSGYVDLEAPNAASSSTIDLDQVPQKNVANTFTTGQNITVPTNGGLTIQAGTNGSASLRLKNDATDWDVNCQTTDNFAIYNHTTGGNRLGITPAGIVTTPSQPSCYVRANSGGPWETDDVVIFNGVDTNIGNCYNTSNGRFTAPVNGRYMFSFIAMAPAFFRGQIRKNGAAQTEFRSDHDGATGLNYTQAAITVIYSMSVGDYVDQFISAGIMNGNGNEVQMHAHLLS